MDVLSDVERQNRELAARINQEALRDPRSAYAGKFVGLADGQVVLVADSLDEVARRLRQIEPDPRRVLCLEAGLDYEAVQTIWGVR